MSQSVTYRYEIWRRSANVREEVRKRDVADQSGRPWFERYFEKMSDDDMEDCRLSLALAHCSPAWILNNSHLDLQMDSSILRRRNRMKRRWISRISTTMQKVSYSAPCDERLSQPS